MSNKPEVSEKRLCQLRDAQRRRREKLALNSRHQVNIFLSKKAIQVLDAQCILSDMDRHDLIEKLILNLQQQKFPS